MPSAANELAGARADINAAAEIMDSERFSMVVILQGMGHKTQEGSIGPALTIGKLEKLETDIQLY
jgi:hypothetical protein